VTWLLTPCLNCLVFTFIEIIMMNNRNRIISSSAGPSSAVAVWGLFALSSLAPSAILAISALSALYVPLQMWSSSLTALVVCAVITSGT